MSRLRWFRVLSDSLVVLLIALLAIAFSTGSYRWAFKVNRMRPQAINPVMYPAFTLVNTTRFCCTREPYYNLWRTFDWRTDAYTGDRLAGEFLRVPVVYVHGNGGSYFCARSLARFIYEANVRQRRLSLTHFDFNVRRKIHAAMTADTSISKLRVGDDVPRWVQAAAEEEVVQDHTPMLATEMFSIDYLEESYTQSAVIMLKEARFLNHSMHLLMHNFLETYKRVLALPQGALRTSGNGKPSSESRPYPTANVEDEYVASCCQYSAAPMDPYVCEKAQVHLRQYSTVARLQREVRRVRERGFWVWSESLGGAVAVVAALMKPSLYAGIVFVGSPTHYPPLFFDVGSTWLYRAISDATLRHYPQTASLQDYPVDWDADVLPHDSPLRLVEKMKGLHSESLANRIANVTLLSINGGALDDIVPSITGYLHRSAPRPPAYYTDAHVGKLTKTDVLYGAYRRDLSTETMRGVGMPMDHRGLVYGLQLLNHSADSLVQAALLPQTAEFFATERDLPSTLRDRLFPEVVETLPEERYAKQTSELLFSLTLAPAKRRRRTGGAVEKLPTSGDAIAELREEMNDASDANRDDGNEEEEVYRTYEKIMDVEDVAPLLMSEVCSDDGNATIDLSKLPTLRGKDGERGVLAYDGGPLHLFLGFTTYTPDEVLLPRLYLYQDAARTTPVDSAITRWVRIRPATKMHLPTVRKDSRRSIYGRVLHTVVSFQVTRGEDEAEPSRADGSHRAYARFCFNVLKDSGRVQPRNARGGTNSQQTFFQHDIVDPTRIQREATPRYVGPHYVGNRVQVEMHAGYALVTGLDSSTQETRMQVDIAPNSRVYPFVMAGSLRSLYITARGNSHVPADDPEDQMQYFFGPFVRDQTHFDYSWKPFSTFEGDLNETFIVYVVGDSRTQRPVIALRDLADTVAAASTALPNAATLRWLTNQWPERWLAFFSSYTGIGKLGGAYVLLFFSFFVLVGEAEQWAVRDPTRRVPLLAAPGRRIFCAAPLLILVTLTAVSEMFFGTLATRLLPVCNDPNPPPGLSNEEMTARMATSEKLALRLLYGMRPDYRECQYSWVRMQSIPVWNSFLEHLSTIYFGFALSTIMLTCIFIFIVTGYVVGAVIHTILQTRRIFAWPRLAKLVLLGIWSIPTLSWLALPNLPLCYRHVLSVTVLNLSFFLVPRKTGTSHALVVYMPLVSIAATFPTHFDGAVLTVRNHVMLRRMPEAFWDHERNTNITSYQALVWITVQSALAAAYTSMYYVAMHQRTCKEAQQVKQAKATTDEENAENTQEAPKRDGKVHKAAVKDRYAYVLGDMGRRHATFRRLVKATTTVMAIASAWVSLVALRRPLEGGVILIGNMTLLMFLASRMVAMW